MPRVSLIGLRSESRSRESDECPCERCQSGEAIIPSTIERAVAKDTGDRSGAPPLRAATAEKKN